MRIGLLVNPIAGMGGRVGLKGTDNVLEEAVQRGAEPVAPARATEFLKKLKGSARETPIDIVTCQGIMGRTEAETAGFPVQTLPMQIGPKTSADDTRMAVQLMIEANVDLIVFVGGDGTAKDIFDAQQGCRDVPVLGVPSGVKMYSGIFAISPADAVDIVCAYNQKQAEIAEFEIIDTDEEAIRNDSFALRLHGYMKGPFLPAHIQGSKQASPETTNEEENQTAIAKFVTEEKQPNATWILGPGTTVKHVACTLGVKKTVLGVDIYRNGEVLLDADEKEILKEVKDWTNTWIIVSPLGHQGIVLGRGNQQISPEIIKHVGKERIIVLATKNKLQSIGEKKLRVDTGDPEVDNMLRGYIKVVTDYREWLLMPIQ